MSKTPTSTLLSVRNLTMRFGGLTAIDDLSLEVPAGKLDAPDEDPLYCATRELSEETGYQAERIEKLTTIATTVGFSNEYIHLYLAEGLTPGKQHPDEDEFIRI